MYDSSLKYKWDNKNVRDYAMKEGMEKGMKIGIEKGMEIGIEKGMEIGIKKGERKKALEIARACKKIGMSTENIARGTGLSIEEIESL
jgi:predicted transposase YdaD